jgi:hypothetical protein
MARNPQTGRREMLFYLPDPEAGANGSGQPAQQGWRRHP